MLRLLHALGHLVQLSARLLQLFGNALQLRGLIKVVEQLLQLLADARVLLLTDLGVFDQLFVLANYSLQLGHALHELIVLGLCDACIEQFKGV